MSPRNEPDDEGVMEEVDEDQHEQTTVHGTSRSSKQNNTTKKPKLFHESGLTDSERRIIRQNQRTIQQTLREQEYDTFEELEHVRNTNNQTFQQSVRYTREAVLDADNVDLIASKYAQQIEKQVQVPRFDALKMVQKLSHKCAEAGICFNAVPERVTFLAGVLDQQVTMKTRTVRQARVKDTTIDEVEVKPEAVNENMNQKGDADKLSAMEKAMRVIRKKLKSRSIEEMEVNRAKNISSDQHPDIDGIQFLFNPQSFTQTVENIFNFSFLIKKGEAEIGVRPPLSSHSTPSGAYVALRTYNPDDPNIECTQAVCRFTMADWRTLCDKQSLAMQKHTNDTTSLFTQGDLPHRTGTRHGRTSA